MVKTSIVNCGEYYLKPSKIIVKKLGELKN
jgi:hypothetical protein